MKTILFVCIHNSGRSQVAEAYFNLLAKDKAKGLSAGTHPANDVNSVVIQAMKEIGTDISSNTPKALTLDMVKGAYRMITMGCGAETEEICPADFIETEDWALEDPQSKPIEAIRIIRDEIKQRVTTLIEEITTTQK
ncbi:arsenate reductase ArsC [Chloroflexota bacterium]